MVAQSEYKRAQTTNLYERIRTPPKRNYVSAQRKNMSISSKDEFTKSTFKNKESIMALNKHGKSESFLGVSHLGASRVIEPGI